jgi:LacI family transcriptional regulator
MKKGSVHPTLSDVARVAGVGVGTASRVVNGGVNVSASTLKKVESAIRQLGYRPNHAARVLKGGRTKTVGLLVPSIADSFFASCAEGAGKVSRLHDSLLIVAVTKNQRDAEMSSLDVLMRQRPDGLLIVPSDPANRALAGLVKNSSIPVVTFDRPLFGSGCASVITDNFEAARKATLHLVEHGYKRILCFGGEPELYTIQERLRGYRRAMEEAGLPALVDTSLSEDADSASRALSAHLKSRRPPDAIFTLKNSATISTFQALQELKVSIPSRLALLGFDDFELASTLRPSVSVVQQPIEDVGRKAAELLFAQLDRGHGIKRPTVLSGEPVVLASQLVLRSSCGCKARLPRKTAGGSTASNQEASS